VKIFLSFHFADMEFVAQVDAFLRRQPDLDTFFWDADKRRYDFTAELKAALGESDAFIYFNGAVQGDTQMDELAAAKDKDSPVRRHLLFVWLPVNDAFTGQAASPIKLESTDEAAALSCAKSIAAALEKPWCGWGGIPDGYPFEYEKSIVEAHVSGDFATKRVRDGCPSEWPRVDRNEAKLKNPLPQDAIGAYRPAGAEVVVDARLLVVGDGDASPAVKRLTFPEAGPREFLRFPREGILKVGLLVSGGIAPGTNAIIQSIVCRHLHYQHASRRHYQLDINGYLEGFRALLPGGSYRLLSEANTCEIAHHGGSILGTSRAPELLDENPIHRQAHLHNMVINLRNQGIEILYVMGGDGSMRAAHALQVAAWEAESDLAVVGIPKTTDNDILWVWQSVGITSAVTKASECMLDLLVEIKSYPRLCVLQLPGSDSGFVIGNATLAAGENVCDAALIPEIQFSMKGLGHFVRERLESRLRLGDRAERPYGLVVVGETAVPTDFEDYLEAPYVQLADAEKEAIKEFVREDRRQVGPTPKALRTGTLKLVSQVLEEYIRRPDGAAETTTYWKSFSVFTNSPRNLIRAVAPSVPDMIVAQRLGTLAVDNAMAGYSDFMISQWLTEYVLVPLRLVVLGRKRVGTGGIFWKSVLDTTGQKPDLVSEESDEHIARPPEAPVSVK
jgi:6-phosphofructokinase 1